MALSPLDGRYKQKVQSLSMFNETEWYIYRLNVEIDYFAYLIKLLVSEKQIIYDNVDTLLDKIRSIVSNINKETIVKEIKEIEATTKHDIKAIEYWLRRTLLNDKPDLTHILEYIHFGLTSQDINSVAFSLQLKDAVDVITKRAKIVYSRLTNMIDIPHRRTPMLALTHGQPAVPTVLHKELLVFAERLEYTLDYINDHWHLTKIGGAVGNMNAHYLAFPDIDWKKEMEKFCKELGLDRWQRTTQVSNYDDIGIVSGLLVSMNCVLLDLSRDIWGYISRGIFKLRKDEGQVGSSTMPQKVNPIDFENAEGNIAVANSLLQMMQTKLPVSRFQRDLSDSTVLRNYGVCMGHILVALESMISGLGKLDVDYDMMKEELERHPEVLAEAVQIILRKNGILNGYDIIKQITQGMKYQDLDTFKSDIIEYIKDLDNIGERDKIFIGMEIQKLSYEGYIGDYWDKK